MDYFLMLLASGVMVGGIYALIGVGFVLVYKCSGVFNFAHGAILCLGSFLGWFFLQQIGLPFWLSILISLAIAVILALIIERLSLRPLLGESVLTLIMVTLALYIAINGLTTGIWGGSRRGYGEIFPLEPVRIGVLNLSQQHLITFGIAIVLFIALALFFRYTRLGLAMRGTAEGHQIVRSMGISVSTIIAAVWAIAGVAATISGILLGTISGVDNTLADMGLKAIPVAFIGGLESIPGALVGGVIIGIIENLVGGYIGHGLGTSVAYMVLVVVLIFKPYGLFGLERIERV